MRGVLTVSINKAPQISWRHYKFHSLQEEEMPTMTILRRRPLNLDDLKDPNTLSPPKIRWGMIQILQNLACTHNFVVCIS